MVSKIIIIIASLVSVSLIVGLSMNDSTSSDNNTQTKLENTSPPPFQYADSSIEEKIKEADVSANEFKAIKTVQEYQGIDREGRTIEELTTHFTESLLLKEKNTYPSINFGWTGLPDDIEENDSIYKVIYEMQTDEQSFEVIYNINLDTNEIWAVNEMANDILILADMSETLTNG